MYANNIIYSCMIILLYNDALKTTCNVMISVSEDEQVYNIQNLMLNTFFLQSKAFGYRIYEKTSQQGTWNFLLIYCTCKLPLVDIPNKIIGMSTRGNLMISDSFPYSQSLHGTLSLSQAVSSRGDHLASEQPDYY